MGSSLKKQNHAFVNRFTEFSETPASENPFCSSGKFASI